MRFISTTPAQDVRGIMKEHGLQVDPQYAGEVARLFENRGYARLYRRSNGLTVDGLGELMYSRGVTLERATCREVLDFLDELLRATPKARKARGRKRVTRRAVSTIESEAQRAKGARSKKFVCTECGQIAYASKGAELACGRQACRAIGASMVRVGLTFDEVMVQTYATAEALPF